MSTKATGLKFPEKLSILVPAYNESANIEKTLTVLGQYLEGHGLSYEVIVVDDGSKDKTAELARNLGMQHVKVVRYVTNMGKGYALRAAFDHSSGDVVAFFDAGLDYMPEHIIRFWEIMRHTDADVINGSKRHADSEVKYPLKRRFISWGGQIVVRIFFGLKVKDTQVGMKLWRRQVLADILPKALVKRYAQDIELLALAQRYGYKIVDAPVKLNFNFNTSAVNFKAIWRAGWDTLAVFYRLRILRYYDQSPEVREKMIAKYPR
jgi:glycosyltransferase involved in cell wall biosynthesis